MHWECSWLIYEPTHLSFFILSKFPPSLTCDINVAYKWIHQSPDSWASTKHLSAFCNWSTEKVKTSLIKTTHYFLEWDVSKNTGDESFFFCFNECSCRKKHENSPYNIYDLGKSFIKYLRSVSSRLHMWINFNFLVWMTSLYL